MKTLKAALVVAGALACAQAVAITVVTPPPTSSDGSSVDCSSAALSVGVIWPPNHSMVSISIMDVSSTAGTPVIQITGIQQDEPVNARGDGNTAPDGAGIGTSTALVRAERSGLGTGRYYYISFTATDVTGSSCSRTLQTYVPHDQGQGILPTDTGLRFDSTVIPQ